jgi:hypothetical protein
MSSKVAGRLRTFPVSIHLDKQGTDKDEINSSTTRALAALSGVNVRVSIGDPESKLNHMVQPVASFYSGFSKLDRYDKAQPLGDYWIVVAQSSYGADVWLVDGEDGINALRDYLSQEAQSHSDWRLSIYANGPSSVEE